LICPKHGEFKQIFSTHLKGSGCFECGKEKRRNVNIIEIFNKTHNSKYNYSKVKYTGLRDKIIVICPTHGEFEINAGNHKNGDGCRKCLNESQSYTKDEFIEISINRHGYKYDYSKSNYINNHTKISIICPKHGEFLQNPQYHLIGHGCSECWKQKELENRNKYKEKWLENVKIYHSNFYDYSLVNYYNNSKEVTIICPKHGIFEQKPISHLKCGCPSCNESKGEKEISKKLDILKLKYIREHKFTGCNHIKELRFDFYLPELNICIEYNGKQHYESIEYFGGETRYKEQIIKDNIKRKYCSENGIKLIEIKYNENVQEKLNILT
jgi:very-short-patch-repair endonuclease